MSQDRARRRPVAAPALAAALLLATPAALAQTPDPDSPEQSPSVLTSDTLTYDTENEVVTASVGISLLPRDASQRRSRFARAASTRDRRRRSPRMT